MKEDSDCHSRFDIRTLAQTRPVLALDRAAKPSSTSTLNFC